jgi:hypothetical protein
LQNAPRDEGKLRGLLKLKEKENEQATHMLSQFILKGKLANTLS